jgi:DNA-binding PadR family transcriptional regulator
MPTIVIPKKMCSHCGGTKWYINPKTEQEICYQRLIESNKRYQKTDAGKAALERARAKQRENLTDDYLRQLIYASIYNTTGESISRKSIPKEHIKKYRKNIEFKRQNKLTNHGNKTLKHTKIKAHRERSI